MKTALHLSGFDDYRQILDETAGRLRDENLVGRIKARDHTLWKPAPDEIVNRLGWIDAPHLMKDRTGQIQKLVNEARNERYSHAILLGMGGSSLAPEVLKHTFGFRENYLDLSIIDSTEPAAILHQTSRLKAGGTLVIVSTKSGSTVETLSLFKFFYNVMRDAIGPKTVGNHFVAVTDPGSDLVSLATRYNFRETFLNPRDIGGRYSALTFFGLVPTALTGVNVSYLLIRAASALYRFETGDILSEEKNPAAFLGMLMGAMALVGRDKLTFLISPQVKNFGGWLEQLIAESLGKEGTGIVPIIDEPPTLPVNYDNDRLFVYLRLKWDSTLEKTVQALKKAGHPIVILEIEDLYELGAQFFLWEAATAVAGHILAVNPFDQPDVEATKTLTKSMIAEYTRSGTFPEEIPSHADHHITLYGSVEADTPLQAFTNFLDSADRGDYIALQAYLQPKDDTDHALMLLRGAILNRYGRSTTVGYGPRFLHSTGQLHKGDAGKGIFIQITCDIVQDVPIPDEAGKVPSSLTFGILTSAEARGDRMALLKAGRRVLRIHLGEDIVGGLKHLTDAVT